MKYVLSVGIKLFVLTLILNIGFDIINFNDMAASLDAKNKILNDPSYGTWDGMKMAQAWHEAESINIVKLVELIIQAIILLGLALTLPQTCAGIISGASIEGGNPLRAMAGATAGAAFTIGTGAAGGAINAGRAYQAAGAEGVKGFWNKANRASEIYSQAKLDQNPSSMENQLKSHANRARAERASGMSGGNTTES